MNRHLESILTKLSDAELTYLKDHFGVELRDPAVLAALSELNRAHQQLELIKRLRRSSHSDSGEPLSCTFCGRSANSAGPLVQAPDGACICKDCASHCQKLVEESAA